MIIIKSLIKYDNANCIEVTWVETIEEVETVIHCQAYADVQMDMLRADAEKYGTSLEEYKELIAEVESNIVLPSEEEIQAEIQANLVQEAQVYLNSTDWYVVRFVDEGTVVPEDIKIKRAEAREFVRANSGGNQC